LAVIATDSGAEKFALGGSLNMSIRWCGRVVVLVVITAQWALGSAFAVNELGARAEGMGGAFTSIADDPSAIFFNPAGIAFLAGTNLQMDSTVIAGQFRFFPSNTPPGAVVPSNGFSGTTHLPFIPVGGLYATHRLSKRWAVGFGIYVPFGLAANFTNFNDSDPEYTKYVGRYAGTRAMLQQYWFQPTVAYRISQSTAISIGIAYVHTHLLLEESFLNPYDKPDDFGRRLAKDAFPGIDPNAAFASFSRLLPEGRLRAAATADKIGVSGGYLYKNVNKGFNIGLMYRSGVVSHLKGQAAFAFANSGALVPFLPKDRTLAIEFPNQPIRGVFTTPPTYVIGVSKSRVWGGTAALDLRVQQFDRFQDFPINFTVTTDGKGNDIGTMPEKRLNFNFRNSYLIQGGYEKPLPPNVGPKRMQPLLADLTLRAGYVFDHSPVPDKSVGPLFPDASRNSVTVGMTKKVGSLDLTLFYQRMMMLDRVTNVPENNYQFTNGDYKNFAHLAGVSMRLRLGRQDEPK
jgi:long-chain fatty acid transport protein